MMVLLWFSVSVVPFDLGKDTMLGMQDRTTRWRHYWDKHSRTYDKQMRFMDRVLLRDSRQWAGSQASGDVLEVGIGTGLNLCHYPDHARVTGIDLSPSMLDVARRRASERRRPVELRQGDAHSLPFDDASFDTVVCTLSLCAIPDDDRAIGEMHRVLRPGGRLVLVDHVSSSSLPVRAIQRRLEIGTIPLAGEHYLRRPILSLPAAGFAVERSERFALGLVERVLARKR
jgi:ubiquinone/menaquinone biosynthesis C-methylase UbiE